MLSRNAIAVVLALGCGTAPAGTTITVFDDPLVFADALRVEPAVVGFDDVDTAGRSFVPIASDRYLASAGLYIESASKEGQYVDREFVFASDYPPVSAPNTFAPGPQAESVGENVTTVVRFGSAGSRGRVAGFGAWFIDADFPGLGPSTFTAFDADGNVLHASGTISGPDASQRFYGIVVTETLSTEPSAAIDRVELVTGNGWPALFAAEGVVLDDFTVGPVTFPLVIIDPPPATDPGDRFGAAVAADGNLVAIGVPDAGPGRVEIYRVEADDLVFETTIDVPPGRTAAEFGAALALDGNRLVVGAPGGDALRRKGAGSVIQAAVFERLGQAWSFKAGYTPDAGSDPSEFGSSVALDGDRVVVGAPGEDDGRGAAYLFALDSTNRMRMGAPEAVTGSARFGAAVAAGAGRVAVGAPGSSLGAALTGAIALYDQISDNLQSVNGYLPITGSGSTDGSDFGAAIALSGELMAVGAPGESGGAGGLYRFSFSGLGAVEGGRVAPAGLPSGSRFGSSVAASGARLAAGAPPASGGAGAFALFGTNLQPVGDLISADGLAGQGAGLALIGERLLIGAPETAGATGGAAFLGGAGVVFADDFE